MPDSRYKEPVASLEEVAERAGVSPSTLRRWVRAGAIPQYDGSWTPAAVAHARIVAQLREGGYSLKTIVEAAHDGRLALGQVDELFPQEAGSFSLREASRQTGLEPALIERIWASAGFPIGSIERLTEDDLELFRRIALVLESGLPLVALLQLVRVWGHAFSQIAESESRLFRIYVHEPLLREGVKGEDVAEAMGDLVAEILPHAKPIMEKLHDRYLQQYVEQQQVENLQIAVSEGDIGRLKMAVAFLDIAGFTRFTEEVGEAEAFEQIERLRHAVDETLPRGARLVKMTGDGAMVVSNDEVALVRWALELVERMKQGPPLRAGIHSGEVLFREGDFYGGAVNLAARLIARAAGGEVVVSGRVRDAARKSRGALSFTSLGEVRLKGFSEAVELFVVERPKQRKKVTPAR